MGTPLLISQPSYSMLNRWIEGGLLDVLEAEGAGCIVFSPLAQGLLTGKYLDGVPARVASRLAAARSRRSVLRADVMERVRGLAAIAERRGQSLAQMALAWTLRDPRITSALVGAGSVRQLEENLGALQHLEFSAEELGEIDVHAQESDLNLWAASSAV